MMMPPRNWLAAVLALRMRPQSNEPRKRLTRTSPVTLFTRTSQNKALWLCMDQCPQLERHRRFGFDRHLLAPRAAEDRSVAFPAGLIVERGEPALETAHLVGTKPSQGESLPASFKSSFTSAR